jgi:hypothetical protein
MELTGGTIEEKKLFGVCEGSSHNNILKSAGETKLRYD